MDRPVPELVAPAGDLEKLKFAIVYGADAVYLGGKEFGLRARAGNFTLEEMALGVDFAHRRGKRVYVTVNIFARNRHLDGLPAYLRELARLGVDGVIVADPGVLELVREEAPGLEIHLSTQANTTNWRSLRFWARQGVKRVVLARELTLEEIAEIHRLVPEVELEVFVHGAMCISYSGRCLLSSVMTGRSANLGECAQPCRWSYALVEEKRPGQFFPVEEDERGTYVFNSSDLCMVEHLDRLYAAGVRALKIEGRVKSIHYVATVTGVYRRTLDLLARDPGNYRCLPELLQELEKVSHRPYTTGFFFSERAEMSVNPVSSVYRRAYDFTGFVRYYDHRVGLALVEQRGVFAAGEEAEVLTPAGEVIPCRVEEILDPDGRPMERAPHPRQWVWVRGIPPVPPYSILRRPAGGGKE
ncbi:MAG: family peptidase [Eubacteriales bacterium]|nr:family peptidase [Eubacteriales bacterium]